MSLLDLVLFGALAGAVTNLLDPKAKRGFLGPVVLGIIGALVGAVIAKLLFGLVGLETLDFKILIFTSLVSLSLISLSKMIKTRQKEEEENIKHIRPQLNQ